jgi:hypothetical protein
VERVGASAAVWTDCRESDDVRRRYLEDKISTERKYPAIRPEEPVASVLSGSDCREDLKFVSALGFIYERHEERHWSLYT